MRTITPPDSKLVPRGAERVFKGIIFDVYQWQQEMFDGTTETFEMLKRPDTIKVLAVKEDKIVILDQQQPDQTRAFFDLPGGRHDVESETELDAAKRETLEETGMTFATWKLLDVVQPHGKIEWFVYIYLSTDFIKQTDQKLDAGEKISVELMEFNDLKKLVNDPSNRYFPKDLLDKAQTLSELLSLQEYR